MKKLLLSIFASIGFAFCVSAQVMPTTGVENNVWTGFGSPFSGDAKFYGVIDCLQARVDIARFTVEGMLNWGALAVWSGDDLDSVVFANTERNALNFHYYGTENNNTVNVADSLAWESKSGQRVSNAIKSATAQDSYYVNFLWHPFDNFDVGMGTKLNWQVGTAPKYGSWLWENDAHIRQGGFSTTYDDRSGSRSHAKFTPDAPGSADVVGFVHYANKYAKKAIGIRYNYQGDFGLQIGAAIPNEADSNNPVANVGFALQPVKWLSIAAAYEGIFQKDGNFYAGASIGAKSFILDAYFAWDSIDTDDGSNDPKDMAFGTGAGITFAFSDAGITIRPEAGFNWFENKDWTPAWYAGILAKFDINEKIILQAWSSFSIGSKNKNWADLTATEDWTGGHIFDIRPEFSFNLNKNHSLSAYVDIESRTSFDGKNRSAWSTGVFWTYRLYTGKLTTARK